MISILGLQGTNRAHGGRGLLALLVAVLANGASSSDALAVPTPQPPRIAGLPLNFERNVGQAAGQVQYLAHGPRYSIELTEQGALLAFASQNSATGKAIHLRVQGADRTASPVAEESLPGVVNYFIGNDPAKWQTNIATFHKVRYRNVYPGIDLVYYGTDGKLEYDFALSPGSDARKIALNFKGARGLRIDPEGNLKIRTQDREIAFQTPVAYQIDDVGARSPVSARYRLRGSAVRFEVGAYDHSKQLIIDPVLSYFSYLGGSGYDVAGITPPSGSVSYFSGQTAAVDGAGDLYVTGYTTSTNFPTHAAFAPPPAKANPNGGQSWAFVTKLAPDAKTLIYSTYLGGTGGNDRAAGIAVDSSRNAVVVGSAGSHDFPVTSGAYQTVCNPQFSAPNVEIPNCDAGGSAAFVSKFSPSGALLYSTFLSGSNTNTTANAVAVDGSGRAYVAGETLPGSIVPAGTGGSPQAIPFPTTPGAVLVTPPYSTGVSGYQNVLSAQDDAFITVFDPTLSTLVYSSLYGEPQVSNAGVGFGGASFTVGEAVTVDAAGNFYLAGTSEDGSLETTTGAYEAHASSCGTVTNNVLLNCAFVAKFSPVGSGTPSLVYGTYLGHTVLASYGDLMTGIAADAAGDAYVSGFTNQATFPTTAGAYQATCNQYGVNGNTNAQCSAAFIAKLNPSGTALLASTYFGGYYAGANNVADNINSMGPIVLDANGNVYIAGAASEGLPQVNSLGSNNGTASTVSPFVAEFNSSLTALTFSTLFSTGGPSQLAADGLALDASGNIYVAGSVNSPPSSAATSGAVQSAYGGGSSDAFVAKIVVHTPTSTTLGAAPTAASAGAAINLTATVAEIGGSSVPTGIVTFKDGATTLGSMTLNGTGVAVYTTSSLSVGAHSITAAYGGDAANGSSTSTAASVTVSAAAAPTVTLRVSPTNIVLGQSATLSWSSSNATACSASNAWSGSEALSGTMTEKPTAVGTSSYVLTCTGAGGSAHAAATLTVTAPAPTVTIGVAPTSITVGQSATVTWSSTNATSCTASGAWSGTEAVSGTLSVTPSASGTASYALACTGAGGTANGTASLTVAAKPSGKSGGGGAMEQWELIALSLIGIAAHRRRSGSLR